MNMKLTKLVGEFPTNNEYQIVDVTQIYIKDEKKVLAVKFQNLSTGEIIHEPISIAYARLIVIGTIWKNNAKVKFPSFLDQYQAFNFDFNKMVLSKEKVEFDEFGKIYIEKKKENSKQPNQENYGLVTYDVDLCLIKKEGESVKLFKPNPNWKNQGVIEFISFFPHELFRYFFTSYEISDLNDHFYSHNNAQGNWKESNEVFDTDESVEKDGELYVSFDSGKYVKDTNLIGDCIYMPAYRKTIFSIQNFLNTNGYTYLSRIAIFPIERCKRLTFSGIPITRKSDGAKGLLGFLINECTDYRPHQYTAVLPEQETDDENSNEDKDPKPVTTNNNNNQTPTVRNNSTSSNKPHTIDEAGLEFLLEQQTTHKVKKVKITTEGGGPVIPIVEKDLDKITEPGKDGEPGGKIPELNEYFPQTNFFKDYEKILEGIVNKIRSKGLSISVNHYTSTKEWRDELSFVNRALFNENISSPDIQEERLYITQLVVSGRRSNLVFNLFEANNGSRTLLYANHDFNELTYDNIVNCLNYFPKERNSKDKLKGGVVYYFNHKQTKREKTDRKNEKGKPIYQKTEIEEEKSIKIHIQKISQRILVFFI